jgi:acetyl esterase/lipase
MLRGSFAVALVLVVALAAPLQGSTAEPGSPDIQTYREVEGRALHLHVLRPDGEPSGAAVVLLHGGGWHVGSPEWVYPAARRFAGLGLVAVAVEYRLADDEVTPADALVDTCSAFAWVRSHADELGIEKDKVAGYGVSAGGHLVAAAATVGCGQIGRAGRPDALLLWSPAADVANDRWFERLLQESAPAVDLSPAHHVPSDPPPTSIVHGGSDTLTPLAGARAFCDRIRVEGVRCDLHVYEGLGHLLTRNLANQEDDFDPDPDARADGVSKHASFLTEIGFTTTEP